MNFGSLNELTANAPIETFGKGARGFNVYDGTLNQATFDRITTHADGAVGVQISKPVGRIVVRRGIETFGGTGESLVKGVVMTLSAINLKRSAAALFPSKSMAASRLTARASRPLSYTGTIDALRINGGAKAAGGGFDKI